jgi:hypothetical protein
MVDESWGVKLLEVNAEPDFKQTGHRLQRVVKTIVDVRPPLVLHFMPRTVPMGGAK